MGPRPIHWPDILTAQGTCENQPSNWPIGADQALKAPEFNHRAHHLQHGLTHCATRCLHIYLSINLFSNLWHRKIFKKRFHYF